MNIEVQKEFRLEETDRSYGNKDEDPTLVTIRQATAEENSLHEVHLSKLKREYSEEYSDFLKFGYKVYKENRMYENYVRDEDYIDDVFNRLSWLKEQLEGRIAYYEISLTLSSCNITGEDGKTPYIEFENGYVKNHLPNLHEDVMMEMHKKVLEMNPSWAGEIDRVMMFLAKASGVNPQVAGNFADLAQKSIFVKSKSRLISLMQEINKDVFDNEGAVKLNVPSRILGENTREYEFAIKKTEPPLENIVLFPIVKGVHQKVDKEKYIGIIEHGKHEIKIVTKQRGFKYWDTYIENIIPALRTAIEWYARKPKPVRHDNEDTSWMNEAQDVYNDMAEDGFFDDD